MQTSGTIEWGNVAVRKSLSGKNWKETNTTFGYQ